MNNKPVYRNPGLEGPITYSQAAQDWHDRGPHAMRGVTIIDHWHVLNLWLQEDEAAASAPSHLCGLVLVNGKCFHCQQLAGK